MQRRIVLSVFALGLAVTTASAAGVYATFSDTASTGQNSFATAGLAKAIDLQLAEVDRAGTCSGATYSENLTTGLITVANAVPQSGSTFMDKKYCVRNAGSLAARVTTSLFQIVDTDPECTGDEAAVDVGDATAPGCGDPGSVGELSSHVIVGYIGSNCTNPSDGYSSGQYIKNLTGAYPVVDSLAPGECATVQVRHEYNPSPSNAQIAQSDVVTWRMVFNGAEVPST